jgi:hypothetical protein
MMRTAVAIRSLLFSVVLLALSQVSFGQVAIGISVGFAPPAIPVYEQPICPADGWLWTPGYWDYTDDGGYFWVPGTWVEPPEVGFLWTPGYWGWGGSAFLWHAGYWGPHVGFYGGINYGFGYGGFGFEGGRWEGGHFSYNVAVMHVNTTIIHNTYNTRITNVTENHVSYNGGEGGVRAEETAQERSYASERHVGAVAAQTQHVQEARNNPQLRASANQGKPPIAATARPGDFKSGAGASREAGGENHAPANAARRANDARPESGAAGRPSPSHAADIESHKSTPPNTGNANLDKKYQQQQDKLAAKQNQEHQKLQQQQEKEHQQAAKKNYNDQQKAQMEQRHQQQTQQLEQNHSAQTQHLQERQAPAPRAAGGRH